MTRLRITPADIPGQVLDRPSMDVSPTDSRRLMQILGDKRAEHPGWRGWGRLAIEARNEETGRWHRYEEPR